MIPTKRINREEALYLLQDAPLGELARVAHELRLKRHPERVVTFVCDTNPNYTNICVTRCRFCAFCRVADESDAYTLTPEELAAQVKSAAACGATTVLLQGGHNPQIFLADWLAYIKAIREACTNIHVHPFSPSEIIYMAGQEQTSVKNILFRLKDAGINTMPGGGAEVLTERVRKLLSPAKITCDQWLAVMEEAHKLGYRTTATMMFGHIETDEEIIEHLLRLRELQDRTGGFTSFIPWSFKSGSSPLSREVPRTANPAKYVRVIATARVVLDNFAHIQSSWFSENVTAGQLGLLAGADDFGGILIEENVLRKTGFAPKISLENLLLIIKNAGFKPAQRNSHYQIIKRY